MVRLGWLAVAVMVWMMAAWPLSARAEPAASDWAAGEGGQVRLVSATTTTGKAAVLRLGLQFQLQPGWKIYWRSPGDAGYPPKLDWAGSRNAGDAQLFWPAPKRFVLAGLQNYGYGGEVVLPIDLALPQPHRPVALRLAVDYLACAQICVPATARLKLDVPAGPSHASAFQSLISHFSNLVPGPADMHGFTVESLQASGAGDASVLTLVVRASHAFSHPDLFVEPPELASFEAPSLRLDADGTRATFTTRVVAGTLSQPLAAQPLTLTLVDGVRAMEFSDTPVQIALPAPPAAPAPATATDLAPMLMVAVLGGLILNLMPCVLPVLSIKLLGALSHGGGQLGHIRAAFLASAAGILASFWLLAGGLVAVKAAGAAVGWGIQFQHPAFLLAMIAVLIGFAANLWGLYEIRLPSWAMNAGPGGIAHHTLLGHFLSGAFATLLATPCSAPFLGTAIGFALARGPVEIGAIFTALGLGLALPYLAVAIWPRAAQALPRPGAWMVRVRQILGVALALTALWLGWVLTVQTGWLAAAPATAGASAGPKAAIAWTAFDQGDLAQRVAAGQVVLVDVTADWCITCKVNKATVIERGPVAERLASGQVVAMRADWTRPDDTITRYLASFGRYGIPFNAVYGPAAPAGIALPELPGSDDILHAFDLAAGKGG